MARIRTIKPDFWDSPATGQASLRARLLFIAMWNWADDFGIGDAHSGRLWNFAFPNDRVDPADIPAVYAEVADLFGVIFYEHEGRPYYYIPSWNKHQKIDRRSVQKVPYPDESAPTLFPAIPGPPKPADIPPKSQRNQPVGTEELGTEELNNIAQHKVERSRFEEFWSVYPRKVGKQKARTKYDTARKRASQDQIIEGAKRLASDPNLPEVQFIPHAKTWLERDGWDDDPYPPRDGKPQLSTADPRAERIKARRLREIPIPQELYDGPDPTAPAKWQKAFLDAIGDGATDQQATEHANTQIGR